MFATQNLLMTIHFDRRRELLAAAERRHGLLRRTFADADTADAVPAPVIPFPATDPHSSPSRVRVA